MPLSAEELARWERRKAQENRKARPARPQTPEAAWRAKQRKKEARRQKALVDADLYYYYRPEIFTVIR